MDESRGRSRRLLDPIDRISEVLFGLIMVLTSTNTLSVIGTGRIEVRTMIIGALGCNLAWGIIDGVLYLLGCLSERGRNYLMLQAVRHDSPDRARRGIADLLPERVAAATSGQDLEAIRQKLLALPEPARPRFTGDDWLGAAAVCLLVFLSTFPVVIPFFFFDDVQPALRLSNAIAIAMLFACGFAFARYAGLQPWFTSLLMVAVGCAMVGVAILLGG